jgi:hypothetical protein
MWLLGLGLMLVAKCGCSMRVVGCFRNNKKTESGVEMLKHYQLSFKSCDSICEFMSIRPPAIKWTELGKCLTGPAANDYSCGVWSGSGSVAEGTADGVGRIPVL